MKQMYEKPILSVCFLDEDVITASDNRLVDDDLNKNDFGKEWQW